MFFGEYERTVDYKGRLTIPAHLLGPTVDADWSKVMLLKGEHSCLYVYDLATWKSVLDEAYKSMDDGESRIFMHRVLSDAALSDVDNLKRITIPAPLLEFAAVEKRCMVIGMFNRLELWSPEAWAQYLEEMADVPVPSIEDLSRARIREVS